MRGAVALLLVLASSAAQASGGSEPQAYVGPTNPTLPRIDCVAGAPGCVGGAVFPPGERAPVSLEVVDLATPVVDVLVCQDTDLDGNCGEPDEPRWNECGRWIELPPDAGFEAAHSTTVFIIAGARCGNLVATTGTISLEYG